LFFVVGVKAGLMMVVIVVILLCVLFLLMAMIEAVRCTCASPDDAMVRPS